MTTRNLPLTLTLHPWWQDHCFAGRAVLPAVETLLLLAETVADARPDLDLRVMEHAVFTRFLVLPPDTVSLPVVATLRPHEDGGITAALCSRIQGKTMSRLREHGSVRFAGRPTGTIRSPEQQESPRWEIEASRIYQNLVPFGPTFHSLTGRLSLSTRTATGTLQTPTVPFASPLETRLGSPFPLDGAMHAACVLGQRLVDFVPFPVGFARRCVFRPTRPGETYATHVRFIRHNPDELVFDLSIDDDTGQPCETVTGLVMRDVSGGRITPPTWIKASAF